jgi:phosphate transport system substrate-binding protein
MSISFRFRSFVTLFASAALLGSPGLFAQSAPGTAAPPAAAGQAAVAAPGAAATAQAPATAQALAAAQQLQLQQLLEQIPPYRPTATLKGKVVISGSTTMADLGHQWVALFKKFHPEVEFSGTPEGSDKGIRQLADDPTVIAGVSRGVDGEDLKILQSGKVKKPMAIVVATDAMAVFVHKDNPIASLSPEQLTQIYSAAPGSLKWGTFAPGSPIADQPVKLYEREAGSASQVFVSRTLLGGRTANQVNPGNAPITSNAEIVAAIGKDPLGIAIGELSTQNPSARKVPLLIDGSAVPAESASVLAGRYPLMRPLMLVVDQESLAAEGGVREAVLRFVLSRDGQMEVMKAGFYPLNPSFIRQQLDQVSGQQLR